MYNHLSYLCILTCIFFVQCATVNVGIFHKGEEWDRHAGTRDMQTQSYDTRVLYGIGQKSSQIYGHDELPALKN